MSNEVDKDYIDNRLDELFSVFSLRAIFMFLNVDEFLEEFKNDNDAINFFGDLDTLINCEPGFLLLNEEYFEKCYLLIEKFRFKGNKNYDIFVNDIIDKLNKLKGLSMSKKIEVIDDYKQHFNKTHEMNAYSKNIVYDLIASDLCVLNNFLYGENEDKLDSIYTYSSLNAILNEIPELIQDEEAKEQILFMMDNLKKEKNLFGRGLQKSLKRSTMKKFNSKN